jgi:4-amino-4-deoxy-L-arabinose transferase-like glycosyltransferase
MSFLRKEVADHNAQAALTRESALYWRDPMIWAVVVLALLIRVAYNLALHANGHPPTSFVIDEHEYFGAAHMLVEGRGFSFYDTALWVRPPLYVTSLAAVFALAGDSYLPTLIFQSLLSALTLPALGWLAFLIGGRTAGRWAVILACLYLPFTLFAGLLLSETLFAFLFTWSLVLLLLARDRLTGAGGTPLTRGLILLAAAGFIIGLGVLTRSTGLGFLPLAALWLRWTGAVPLRRRILSACVLVLVCGLTILPWVVRNYAAYGHLLIDSTGGYNLWLGSTGVRDEARLQGDLLTIPNPADRESYAYSQAFANILADPVAFAGKGVKESLDLWRPSFGAEERQVKGFALGRVPAFHLVSLFLFDDVLYLAILLLSGAGLALSPPHPLKSLTALWVLLWIIVSFIVFAVTRFRMPVVACLVPWAGAGAASLGSLRSRLSATARGSQVAAAIGMLAIVLLVAPSISVEDTWLGIERWTQQAPYREAETLLSQGKPQQAEAQYRLANAGITDTRYGLAASLLQQDRPTDALAVLQPDEPADRFEPLIIKGEAARQSGDLTAARALFNSRVVQVASGDALDWAWDHLSPPPAATLQIGSGLDVGYIRGFFGPETAADGTLYRWSTDAAEVRWSGALTSTTFLWNGWRPQGTTSALLYVAQQPSPVLTRRFDSVDNWLADLGSSLVPAQEPTNGENCGPLDTCVQLRVNSFIGSGADPRLLGIRLSSISAKGDQ